MVEPTPRRAATPRRDRAVVAATVLAATGMSLGWLAAGGVDSPDDGLQQIDVLYLSERVPGLEAVDGRPTMVVLTCAGAPQEPRRLDPAYGLVVSTDPVLAETLALPRATSAECYSGYVLLDADGVLRYRSYDPGWARHDEEQEILLESVGHHP